jgi:hypothetical protein
MADRAAALDLRPYLILPDGGLTMISQASVRNAAHAVLLVVAHIDRSAGRAYNLADDYQMTVEQVAEVVMDEVGHSMELMDMPFAVARSAWPVIQNATAHHRLVDTSLIREELGYRDLVHPLEGLRTTIRWQIDNLRSDSIDADRVLEDPYDYAAEDRLVEVWQRFMRDADAVDFVQQPGFSSGYYGPVPNPTGARRSFRT